MSYKNCLPFVSAPGFLSDSCCSSFYFFCVVLYLAPCCDVRCDVRCDFHIKTMFLSSLPPVVCMTSDVLFFIYVYVCV